MMLYVMRHALAEDAAAGVDDAARHLTEKGRERTRAAAAGMRAMGIVPDVILTSPLARALETADAMHLRMRKGACVALELPIGRLERGGAELHWMMTQRQLRKLKA